MASQTRTHKREIGIYKITYMNMKLPTSSLFSIILASLLVNMIAANGLGSGKMAQWKEVVSIVEPLLKKALTEHGDRSIVSNAKMSETTDKYIDLTRFVATSDKHFAVTNIIDSGARVEDKNRVETISSFMTLTCICDDYDCKQTKAMDMKGAIESDNHKYLGRTPLLFLDQNQKVDCLADSFQYSLDDITSEGCDLVLGNSTAKKNHIYVKNCANGKIENLRITKRRSGTPRAVIARPLDEWELFPDNMNDSGVLPSKPISDFLEDFKVPKTTFEFEVPLSEVPWPPLDDVPVEVDVTRQLEKVQNAMIKSLVDTVGSIMLPETFNETSYASDATIASYFRILMDFSIRRMRKPLQSERDSSVLSGEPLYLDLIASRPQTTALPEIISGDVLLALTAGSFGWFLGVMEAFQLFVASLAFGAELSAFILRWKAEVDLENWEEDMVLVDTTSDSRTREIPLALGRDMNPITVSITMAKVVNSQDWSTEMGFLIAGAIIAGICLILATYLGHKDNKKRQDLIVLDARKVASDDSIKSRTLQQQVAEDKTKQAKETSDKVEDLHSPTSEDTSVRAKGTEGNQTPSLQEVSSETRTPERAHSTPVDCSEKGKTEDVANDIV